MTFLTNAKGEPLLLLGTQTHNSSVGDPEMMARELAAVKAYGGNLLEAPIYWYKLEREPGQYDFSDVDGLLSLCRENDLYLILLWFGTSKNGHPNYVPEWVKLHPETYRLAQGPDGGHVASLSPLCPATLEADSRAFAALMAHLKEADGQQRTVLAVQVENEMGLANTDMDYSPEAHEALTKKACPSAFTAWNWKTWAWSPPAAAGGAALAVMLTKLLWHGLMRNL